MSASARQVAAFQQLLKKVSPETLPDDLREVLQLRLSEPEMSLRAMGERLSPDAQRGQPPAAAADGAG